MAEEEIKIKMNDGVARFFTRFGGIKKRRRFVVVVVVFWEAQPCLRDSE